MRIPPDIGDAGAPANSSDTASTERLRTNRYAVAAGAYDDGFGSETKVGPVGRRMNGLHGDGWTDIAIPWSPSSSSPAGRWSELFYGANW